MNKWILNGEKNTVECSTRQKLSKNVSQKAHRRSPHNLTTPQPHTHVVVSMLDTRLRQELLCTPPRRLPLLLLLLVVLAAPKGTTRSWTAIKKKWKKKVELKNARSCLQLSAPTAELLLTTVALHAAQPTATLLLTSTNNRFIACSVLCSLFRCDGFSLFLPFACLLASTQQLHHWSAFIISNELRLQAVVASAEST